MNADHDIMHADSRVVLLAIPVICLLSIASQVILGAEGPTSDLDSLVEWLTAHPEEVHTVTSGLRAGDDAQWKTLPNELKNALRARLLADGGRQTTTNISRAAGARGWPIIAAEFEIENAKALSAERIPVNLGPVQSADRRWGVFRTIAAIPHDYVFEARLPMRGKAGKKLLNVDGGISWAEYLVEEVRTPGLDKQNASAWLRRINYVTGREIDSDTTSGSGRIGGILHLNGRALPLTRVLAIESRPGEESLLRALDTLLSVDIVPLPDDRVSTMTDEYGEFSLMVPTGRSYELLFLLRARATRTLKDITVRVEKAPPGLLSSNGLTIPDGISQASLGVIDATAVYDGTVPWPALDVATAMPNRTYLAGERVEVPVRIGNVGAKVLTISKAKLDCSCSMFVSKQTKAGDPTPVSFPVSLQPGEYKSWSMAINISAAETIGRKSKRFIFVSDDPLHPASEHVLTYRVDLGM